MPANYPGSSTRPVAGVSSRGRRSIGRGTALARGGAAATEGRHRGTCSARDDGPRLARALRKGSRRFSPRRRNRTSTRSRPSPKALRQTRAHIIVSRLSGNVRRGEREAAKPASPRFLDRWRRFAEDPPISSRPTLFFSLFYYKDISNALQRRLRAPRSFLSGGWFAVGVGGRR